MISWLQTRRNEWKVKKKMANRWMNRREEKRREGG